MTPRLTPFTVAPDGVAALVGVENYLKSCGLDHRLLTLVKVRVSQINGCAYCLHMHTEEARKLGETPTRLYLLDAWHEFEPLFRSRAGGAGLGRIADKYLHHARPRRGLRAGRASIHREGAGGSLDRHRDDQCLEPALDRHARSAPFGYGEGGIRTRIGAIPSLCAQTRARSRPRRSGPCLSGGRPCMVDSMYLNPAGRRHDSDPVGAAGARHRDAA